MDLVLQQIKLESEMICDLTYSMGCSVAALVHSVTTGSFALFATALAFLSIHTVRTNLES